VTLAVSCLRPSRPLHPLSLQLLHLCHPRLSVWTLRGLVYRPLRHPHPTSAHRRPTLTCGCRTSRDNHMCVCVWLSARTFVRSRAPTHGVRPHSHSSFTTKRPWIPSSPFAKASTTRRTYCSGWRHVITRWPVMLIGLLWARRCFERCGFSFTTTQNLVFPVLPVVSAVCPSVHWTRV
jgi:hypothetical protein